MGHARGPQPHFNAQKLLVYLHAMTTRLDHPLRRELDIGGDAYTLTIDPQGLRLVPKGRRKGYEIGWEAFVSGDAALATALNASVAGAPQPRPSRAKKTKARRR